MKKEERGKSRWNFSKSSKIFFIGIFLFLFVAFSFVFVSGAVPEMKPNTIPPGFTGMIDFWAQWCKPCREVSPNVEAVYGTGTSGYNIIKANVDVNTVLARQYGITSIPQFVFFKDGKEVGRISRAGLTKEQILWYYNKYLGNPQTPPVKPPVVTPPAEKPPTTTPGSIVLCDKDREKICSVLSTRYGKTLCGVWKTDVENLITKEIVKGVDVNCGACGECNKCSPNQDSKSTGGYCEADLTNKGNKGPPLINNQLPADNLVPVNPKDILPPTKLGLSLLTSDAINTDGNCNDANLLKNLGLATVRISSPIPGTTQSNVGTGTVVGVIKEGNQYYAIILTAGHVIGGTSKGSPVNVNFYDNTGKALTPIKGEIISQINTNSDDVGFLKIPIDNPDSVKVIPIAAQGYSYQENKPNSVVSFGVEEGKPTYIISSVVTYSNIKTLGNFINLGFLPKSGRSGGGLFDCNGFLIGVCSATNNEKSYFSSLNGVYVLLIKEGNNLAGIINQQTPSATVTPAPIIASNQNTKPGKCTKSDGKTGVCSSTTKNGKQTGVCVDIKSVSTPAPACVNPLKANPDDKATNQKCVDDVKKYCGKYEDAKSECKSANNYKTSNFIVTSNDGKACNYAYTLEYYRCAHAVNLNVNNGNPFLNWAQPVPVTIQIDSHLGAGGKTTFVFHNGEVFGWRMSIQGSPLRVLDSVIPHEVMHMILASYFRQPLPRWADEGFATSTEGASEVNKYRIMLVQFLQNNRGIAFNQMFTMMDYPPDTMPLYAQGYSLADYLLRAGGGGCVGQRKYLEFLKMGTKNDDWATALKTIYGINDLGHLQNSWLGWVKKGQPPLCASVPKNTVR